MKVCSKSKAKSIFHLTENDVAGVKFIYLENNTTYQFYKYDDIEQIVINKYGSIDNLQDIINKKNRLAEERKNNKENNKIKREHEIKNAFMMNKLEFKNYGDAYSYIHYGKPSLDEVITNEINKMRQKMDRRVKLSNELSKLNIILDESIGPCYEYVNSITTKSLEDNVRNIEIEHFLKCKTDYIKLKNKFNDKIARELAICNYVKDNELPKSIRIICRNYNVPLLDL